MNKATLDKYVEEGWLIRQSHPTLPLSIYNYSQSTQYEKHWDDITLSCRGVITDDETGKVIIKPFPKFFNYEELPATMIPWSNSDYVYVQEKMDGSLGILFNYDGEWILSTRGSFTSDQAIRGLEILKAKYTLPAFDPSFAYLLEIIYPENRIVVNYKKEKITFLGVVLNRTYNWNPGDDELHWTTAMAILKSRGVKKSDIVKTTQVFNLGPELYSTLKGLNKANEEGYVLRFFPSNLRVKIKFEDYVALHRVLTNCSSYDIWENLMKFGKLPEQMLKDVPDEFYDWVHATQTKITEDFKQVMHQHMAICSSILRDGMMTQKEFAEQVLALEDVNHGIIFGIASGKDVSEKVWKMVKPTYSKPFSNNFETNEN